MLWPEALLAITAVICFTSIAHSLIDKIKRDKNIKITDANPKIENYNTGSEIRTNAIGFNQHKKDDDGEWLD